MTNRPVGEPTWGMAVKVADAALIQGAREWYHQALPGGMPIDWIMDARRLGDTERLARASLAAGLDWTRYLHLDADGNPSDYRNCAMCGS